MSHRRQAEGKARSYQSTSLLGGHGNSSCGAARHPFLLVVHPLDKGAGVGVGAWCAKGQLIGVVIGTTAWNHTGRRKDAGHIPCEEMIFVRIIDPFDSRPGFDSKGLRIEAVDIVSSCLLRDSDCDRSR
jgi:hypothetical protein